MGDRNHGPEVSRMIDVRHALVQSSSRVQVSDLAKQGRKTISVLSKDRITDLINQALRQLVERQRAAAAPAPVDDRTAVENAKEMIVQFQETEQAQTDLEASRKSLFEELNDLRQQVAREKAVVEGRIKEEEVKEEGRLVGSPEFDRHLGAIVARVFEQRKSTLAPAESPEALKELQQLQSPIQDLVLRVAREERGKLRGQTRADMGQTWMLEKRIEKLYSHLMALENALKAISTSKLKNNQQVLQALRQLGLVNEDKHHEKKREMLKIVLDTNKHIRKNAKEMESQGITLASPRRMNPPLAG